MQVATCCMCVIVVQVLLFYEDLLQTYGDMKDPRDGEGGGEFV